MFNKFKFIFLNWIFLFTILFWSFPKTSIALTFLLPNAGNEMVGALQTVEVKEGEDFSDIAMRYDIGYYELFEANPKIDPDNPIEATLLIIPTQYILPPELRPNLILINLAEMRLYYQPPGQNYVYIFPVGIGKVDWDTPTGKMRIVKKIKNPAWVIPETIRKYRALHGEVLPKVIPAGPENPMGSFAVRLSGGDYLIHGTNLPAAVGRRSTAGCIRLYEEDIEQLFNMVEVGTHVLIVNHPYKAGWHNGKLYLEAHMPLLEQRLEMAAGDMTPVIAIVDKKNKNHPTNVDWEKAFQIAEEHISVPRVIN